MLLKPTAVIHIIAIIMIIILSINSFVCFLPFTTKNVYAGNQDEDEDPDAESDDESSDLRRSGRGKASKSNVLGEWGD